MHRTSVRNVLTVLALAIGLGAQEAPDPAARIAARWPAPSLAKASEAAFEVFVAGEPAATRLALLDAFLGAQYAAQGIGGRVVGSRVFLVPSTPAAADPVAGDRGVGEGPEPNGDPNGTPPGVPTAFDCGDQGEGTIDRFGDQDWWRFVVTAGQDVTAVTGPGRGAAPLDDTVLELRDVNGAVLLANDDAPGRGRYSQVTMSLVPGTYFLVVRGFASVRTGSYALDLSCSAAGGGGQVGEAPEPNDTAARAARMACNDLATGIVGFAGDRDWFGFTLANAGVAIGETGPAAAGAIRDTTLTLFDTAGNALLFDDDGGNGLYSRIETTLAAGTYYWSVAGFGSNTGGYELRLTCSGNVAGGEYDVRGGGCAGVNGVPTQSVRALEQPRIASTFAIDFAGWPALATGFVLVGTSITQTADGVPLPYDLGQLGAAGCLIEVAPDVVEPLRADATGGAVFYLPIPDQTSLVGARFHTQAAVLDIGANPLGATTSNRGDGRIGSRL